MEILDLQEWAMVYLHSHVHVQMMHMYQCVMLSYCRMFALEMSLLPPVWYYKARLFLQSPDHCLHVQLSPSVSEFAGENTSKPS